MTKSAVAETLDPLFTAIGQDIVINLQRALRAMNWAYVYRQQTHLCMAVGEAGWDDYPSITCGDAGSGLAVSVFNAVATGSSTSLIDTDIWVDADDLLRDIEVGVECDITTAANTITTTFTFTGGLGSASATVACAQANNDTEVTNSFDLTTVTSGGEWVRVQILIQRTAGAATDNVVRHLRISETEIGPGILADPSNS